MKIITLTVSDDAKITVDGKEYIPVTAGKPERALWTPKEGEMVSILGDDVARSALDGLSSGSNYIANDDTFPTKVTFANGRKVSIAFNGDQPYLAVSRKG